LVSENGHSDGLRGLRRLARKGTKATAGVGVGTPKWAQSTEAESHGRRGSTLAGTDLSRVLSGCVLCAAHPTPSEPRAYSGDRLQA